MSIAIHYSAVKTPPKAGEIYGLQVAVLDFIKAWLRFSRQETLSFLISDETGQREIMETAQSVGIDLKRLALLDGRFPRENFAGFNVIFRADSDPHDILWQRCLSPSLRFAFCGLAHAIAGLEGGSVLEKYCLAPSCAGDAVVCPSHAVKAAIGAFWEIYGDYIERRFGAKFRCPVRLPVIPLGIDIEKRRAQTTPEKRAEQRRLLELNDDDVAVLWVGRLSHAIKAHPLAMFRAVEDAAVRTGKKVHFLMQGYFVPQEAASSFRNLARDVCRTAKVSFIANNDPRFPDGLWAGADIFLSLVDNMQESFGLTPIEAIAAGLPRVISDWNGYRDSVTHGEDGFLVPTLQPPQGMGGGLSALLLGGREVYGGFLAKTALSVAVDHHAAADALVQLIENPAMRRRMVESAQSRLLRYEWQNILHAYEALWDDCVERRKAETREKPEKPWPSIPPQMPDPFSLYAAYPTAPLKEADTISVIAPAHEIKMLLGHDINVLACDMMAAADDVMALLNWISARENPRIADILERFPAIDRPVLWRTLGWLAKLGIIRAFS